LKRLAILPLLALPAVGLAPAAQAASTPLAPLVKTQGSAAPGQYIVTVKSGTAHRDSAMDEVPKSTVTHVFQRVMNGSSAHLDGDQLAKLRRDPNVVKVTQATTVHTMQTQDNPDWGLDRLDASKGLDQKYTYNHTGKGVTAYVIDTGIDTSNADFGGRAKIAHDATGGDGKDCNGHGTHVAGTIGGKEYGVAKDVSLQAVRVLDCQGSGTDADVVAGMEWVAGNAAKPAVANMSLGGQKSSSIDDAAKKLADAGVFLAVAAGNESADACNGSPSGVDGIMTVAASDKSDKSADFTNHGKCVEVYAPGVDIKSDWLGGGTNTISGTSMATPHVVGVAALYKEANGDASEKTVTDWIVGKAAQGAISGVPSGTPNALLNTGGL
jgi:subtilisin family serine protease